MNSIAKFMLRKVVYVVLGTGTLAVGTYLAGRPDIADWTLKGAGIAAGTAVWGALLSNLMGGSLTQPKP